MKWSGVVAAWMFAAAAAMAAQQQPSTAGAASAQPAPAPSPGAAGNDSITLQGCVRPAVDPGRVIVTDVTEVAQAGRSTMPAEAHGRKVIFWLDKDDALKSHVGQMVQVTGTLGDIEKSEAELKAGSQKDGGLVVEFEGPGRDVKASNQVVGEALGTSGRTTPEKDDVPTFLMRVQVRDVRQTAGTCP